MSDEIEINGLMGGEREPELAINCEISGAASAESEFPVRGQCRRRYHPAEPMGTGAILHYR